MVKALKTTPRVAKPKNIGITPRNNNPKSVGSGGREKPVAEVKFHVKRIK